MAKIFKVDFLKMVKMQIGPFGSEPSLLFFKKSVDNFEIGLFSVCGAVLLKKWDSYYIAHD